MAQNNNEEIQALRLQIEQLNSQLTHVDHHLRQLEGDDEKEAVEADSGTQPPPPKEDDQLTITPSSIELIESNTPAPQLPSADQRASEPVFEQTPSQPEEKAPKSRGDWEMQLGRIWFARIGMLLFLTGLIFLSNYAYQNYIFDSSATTKVSVFLALSLSLVLGGLILEKRKERYKQYGQVISAGGLAAAYYTLYAAHFTPVLKIIESPILAASLLTIWAIIMLGYAAIRRSQAVAVLALGFAFYGTILNPSGTIALFSSLLLSAGAMFLLLRFRWAWVGLTTIIAAYLAHAFWLGYTKQAVDEPLSLAFLASYWILFAIAISRAKARQLPAGMQKLIGSLNNSAAWTLLVFKIPSFTPIQHIGWVSLGVGLLWMLIAARSYSNLWWSNHLSPIWGSPPPKHTQQLWAAYLIPVYAFQGLAVATFGLISQTAGFNRFIILGVAACLLLSSSRYFGGKYCRFAALIVYTLSLYFAVIDPASSWIAYAGYSLVLALFAIQVRGEINHLNAEKTQPYPHSNFLSILAATIPWIAFGLGCLIKFKLDPALITGSAVVGVTIIMGFASRYTARFRDLAITALIFSDISAIFLSSSVSEISPLSFIAPALVCFLLWKLSERLIEGFSHYVICDCPAEIKHIDWVFSALFWLMVAACFGLFQSNEIHWLWTGGLIALAGTLVQRISGRASSGVPALFFHLLALKALIDNFTNYPKLTIIPVALLAVHMLWIDFKVTSSQKRVILNSLGILLAAQALYAVLLNVEATHIKWVMPAVGLALALWGWRRQVPTLFFGAVTLHLAGAFFLTITSPEHGEYSAYFPAYFPILAILFSHALLWKSPTLNHTGWKLVRGSSFFIGFSLLISHATRHVYDSFDGEGISIIWGLLAIILFSLGLLLKHRSYRWTGLILIAMALGYVMIFDVMKLDTLGRILSFMTLGAILLSLGYLYNRFHEKIRELL